MTNGRPVTNDRLYDTINAMRLELKGDITRLESKFDTLEAGRLTRLEGKMSDFEVAQSKRDAVINNNQAVMSTKFLVIWGIAGSIFVAIVTATAYRMIVGPKL